MSKQWVDGELITADKLNEKVSPIYLKTTFFNNDKRNNDYSVISAGNDLYILNDIINKPGVINITGKFVTGTINLYLLRKNGNSFIVVDKETKTITDDGWNDIVTDFYAKGTGDEYIGIIGKVYFAYKGGKGFYNLSSADIKATKFITSNLVADSDFSIFATIENSNLSKVINEKIGNNEFKTGIKDFSKYTAMGASTTYVMNEPLKDGSLRLHIKSATSQSGSVCIVKKDGLKFTILDKKTINFVVGENLVDMNYKAIGDGTEYITTTGSINYANSGGNGLFSLSSGSSVGNINDSFNGDDHTNWTTDLGIYVEYKGELSEKYDDLSKKISDFTPKLLLTDYTMPKYSEIVDPVGFIGRWFDKTIGGVQTKTTINQGSELYFKVKNTKTINVNFVLNTALKTPVFAYSIDGAPMKRQLTTSPTLPPVTNGEHIIRIVVEALDEHEDKWNGEKGVSFNNVTVDSGGTVTGVLPKNRKIMFFGDSITEGIRVLSMDANPNGNSATGAWPFIASEQLNSISYRVGFGASGVTTGGSGYVPPLLQNIDNMTASKTTPYYEPDIVVVNIGTNDGKSTSSNFITQFNTALDRLSIKYSGTPIFVILPFNGAKRSEITTCVSDRTNVYLVDTAGWGVSTTDGVHPNQAGGITAGNKTAEYITSILGKNYFI
ncbi:neck passage structure protein [Leuconostoc phage LN25]|uniref:SGNH hydrolase-type esterase domain-containing protein n=1 Tax=Leuconostoc phage LN25 TaxID=1262518 RepID=A0A059PAK3_9CAUD|nr:neck passage structure protein [Leuconostoc phage LN25]AFY98407.1 hypothetical protein phiLN25_038 [Leuconostoc phage LN25]